jgi:hypothetical protein
MATILGSTTRRRRKRLQGVAATPAPAPTPETVSPDPTPEEPSIPESVVIGKELCRRMVQYPRDTPIDPEHNRRPVPSWIRKEDHGLFHAFCVAHDVLGTSYRPKECLYWDGSD